MNPQEQFEALYADYTQTPIEQIVAARLGDDSYILPSISKAWVWYKMGWKDCIESEEDSFENDSFGL